MVFTNRKKHSFKSTLGVLSQRLVLLVVDKGSRLVDGGDIHDN